MNNTAFAKEFKTRNWGRSPMRIESDVPVVQLKPSELHCVENGSLDNKPLFTFVFGMPNSRGKVFGNITLKQLAKGLEELGYKIDLL